MGSRWRFLGFSIQSSRQKRSHVPQRGLPHGLHLKANLRRGCGRCKLPIQAFSRARTDESIHRFARPCAAREPFPPLRRLMGVTPDRSCFRACCGGEFQHLTCEIAHDSHPYRKWREGLDPMTATARRVEPPRCQSPPPGRGDRYGSSSASKGCSPSPREVPSSPGSLPAGSCAGGGSSGLRIRVNPLCSS